MFEFQWPWMFVLLISPFFIWKWLKPIKTEARQSQFSSIKVPFLDELTEPDDTNNNEKSAKYFFEKILLLAAWVFFIIAMAKPVWVDNVANLPISSRNIIVAVDLSGSMSQRDFKLSGSKISRLAAIKRVAAEFINNRVGDRIGLILFADHAYLQAPLTRDRETVMTLLGEAELGLAGERTALGNAIALAVKKVQEQPEQDHVLVLMTDGAATVGISVSEAIQFARKVNLKIYTIGIGSISTKKSKLAGRNKTISSDLDDTILKNIAEQTGGLYFRAKNILQLQSIYQKLDELEPVIDITEAWHPTKDIFYIPLALSCLLLILLAALRMFTNMRPFHERMAKGE